MAKTGQYDGAIIGGLLGLIIAYPGIGSFFFDFFESVIPSAWDWFGTSTINIFIILAGVLIGFITDKTR